jgi:hypothetical protein
VRQEALGAAGFALLPEDEDEDEDDDEDDEDDDPADSVFGVLDDPPPSEPFGVVRESVR